MRLCCVVLWFGCAVLSLFCHVVTAHTVVPFVDSCVRGMCVCVCVLLALLLNNPAYHLLLSDLTHGPNRLTNCHSQQEKPQNLSQGKRERVHVALRKGQGVVSSPGSSFKAP